ncbi:MAG TPA: hypothetical protein VFO85_18185 [Vicinamibacteria bacterium]|nr:hypothetical protein [Vicinamibacteria bacterium]
MARLTARSLAAPVLLALAGSAAEAADPPAVRTIRKPKDSWTLQVGLAHSADDQEHYVVSGFQARLPVYALDRKDKSDRLGDLGIEIGMYPYPVISRAYVPGTDADPDTPGKFNFWEALGLSYYSPRIGPIQLEAGARLAFINPARRVLTSPNGCGVGNREEPRCNAYIKESMKTLDTILFPSFRGDRGLVTFAAAVLIVKGVGARVELAQLNSGGAHVNARGLRFGITAR